MRTAAARRVELLLWVGCVTLVMAKTFDQQPTTDNPAGGCDNSSSGCYGFPAYKQVSVPSSSSTEVR
jgi:hypothetical protein